jgi:hypothetical protein
MVSFRTLTDAKIRPYREPNDRKNKELGIVKAVELRDSGLFQDTIRAFAWRD